ncbi:MAG: Ldh family oxidoreductase [Bacteroidota bacterium]
METILLEKGVNKDAVHHVVSSILQTSLRGVDSHGINLFPHYCRAVDSGRVNKQNVMVINQTAPSTAIVDAVDSFGHHSGAVAMDYAIKLAGETGMAAVNVTNSTHFGAAAYFALRAANHNMLGFSFTNADALVKAFNSQKAFFGTNPICFTAPLLNEEPLCLDMATSLVSWNKINNYRRTNETIPAQWAYDEFGQPTTNPHVAKSLSPAGEYKGFGLGMMVDILCAVITGGLISKDILPMYNSPIEAKRKISHFFMAIDIQKFSAPDMFKANLQGMVDRIRLLPKLSEGEVMVPGDPEKKYYADRIISGIPMDDVKFEEFMEISQSFKKAVIN